MRVRPRPHEPPPPPPPLWQLDVLVFLLLLLLPPTDKQLPVSHADRHPAVYSRILGRRQRGNELSAMEVQNLAALPNLSRDVLEKLHWSG